MFRFAIMGAGGIARKFCDAVALLDGCCIAAVASKSMARAQALAQEKQIPAAYDSYEQLLQEQQVDCVYIATTPDAHFPLTKLCLEHHTPVLCEKAMFMNQAEARHAFALARENRVFIMEALWSRFLPAIMQAKTWIAEGRIGVPVLADMGVGFVAPKDPAGRYMNPKLGGGAAYDLTVYGVQLLSWVLGREIVRASVEAVGGETGVDETELVLLRFDGNIPGIIRSSLIAPVEERLVICGTKGKIVVPTAHYASCVILYDETGVEQERFTDLETRNGFTYEIEEVIRCIAQGRLESAVVPHSSILACTQIFDMISAQLHCRAGE